MFERAKVIIPKNGWKTEYLIFTDDDSELFCLDKTKDPYTLMHSALKNAQPAVAAATFGDNSLIAKHGAASGLGITGRNSCGPAAPCAPSIDAAFNAFHITAAPFLLPYDPHYDGVSWWLSQALMIQLMAAAVPDHVVQFNYLYAENKIHHKYPRHKFPPAAELTAYLEGRVSSCLRPAMRAVNDVVLISQNRDKQRGVGLTRSQFGFVGGGGDDFCHSCKQTTACETSWDCVAAKSGQNPGEAVNYTQMVTCKPW
jgi:hypothetical protein